MKAFTVALLVVLALCLLCQAVAGDNLRSAIQANLLEQQKDVAFITQFVDDKLNVQAQEWSNPPDWVRYLFAAIFLLAGFIICFFGYQLLPFSVFFMGGLVPAILMFTILASSVDDNDPNKTAIVYGTTIGIWIVFGLIFMCCLSFAVFLLGFAGGAMLAVWLNPIALKYVWPENPAGNLAIWICVLGLLGGVLACCLKRILMILVTALGGAIFFVYSIMAFAGSFDLFNPDETTWQHWAAFGGIIAMAVVGALIQFCFTGKDEGKSA